MVKMLSKLCVYDKDRVNSCLFNFVNLKKINILNMFQNPATHSEIFEKEISFNYASN